MNPKEQAVEPQQDGGMHERTLGRTLARELTEEELKGVTGGLMPGGTDDSTITALGEDVD